MANAETTRTRLILDFLGQGGRSDGNYSNSNIRHDASNEALFQTANAMNSLLRRSVGRIYKDIDTTLTD